MMNSVYCQYSDIPYLTFNQGQETLVFAHANGYPPACYQPLFQQLAEYRVVAPFLRPCWPEQQPGNTDQWQRLVDDMLIFVRGQRTPVVGFGHSMGAVILLMAAVQEPKLFSRLIFVEPAFLPVHWVETMRLLPSKMARHIPLVKKTLNRPDQWSQLQQAFDFHRPKKAFRKLTDDALWHYINGGTQQVDDNYQLIYPKLWEAYFYCNPPRVWSLLKKCHVEVLAIRAESSEFLTPESWGKWQRLKPDTQFVELRNSHHLLPLEQPKTVSESIQAFCRDSQLVQAS